MTPDKLDLKSLEWALEWFEANKPAYHDDCVCEDCMYGKPIINTIRALIAAEIARQQTPETRCEALTAFRLAMSRNRTANNLYIDSKTEAVIEAALSPAPMDLEGIKEKLRIHLIEWWGSSAQIENEMVTVNEAIEYLHASGHLAVKD